MPLQFRCDVHGTSVYVAEHTGFSFFAEIPNPPISAALCQVQLPVVNGNPLATQTFPSGHLPVPQKQHSAPVAKCLYVF